MKKATIDIGSNSVLLLVAEVSPQGIHELANESRVTSLGKGLDSSGVFSAQSMQDTFLALKEYIEIIQKLEVKDITATATEASRVAKNAKNFYAQVKVELGLNVTIIDGTAEAYYTAKGICADLNKDEYTILDIGGASTELIQGVKTPFRIDATISIPFGSVRATDWRNEKQLDSKFDQALSNFDLSTYKHKEVIAVAGTVTTLAAILAGLREYDSNKVHGVKIRKRDLNDLLTEYGEKSPAELLERWSIIGKRSKTIIGGALVLQRIFEELDLEFVTVSTFGLRYGTLLESEIRKEFIIG